jgi:hypothetical protein
VASCRSICRAGRPQPDQQPLREVLLEAGALRFKPILLTALAAMIGAATILLDPIFQGLAISLLFGLTSSTCSPCWSFRRSTSCCAASATVARKRQPARRRGSDERPVLPTHARAVLRCPSGAGRSSRKQLCQRLSLPIRHPHRRQHFGLCRCRRARLSNTYDSGGLVSTHSVTMIGRGRIKYASAHAVLAVSYYEPQRGSKCSGCVPITYSPGCASSP